MSTELMKLREVLATLAHEQWSGWMKYLFSKTTHNSDGSVTIPEKLVKRWLRQMSTAYAELSEIEKDSDRKEAEKFLQLGGVTRTEYNYGFEFFVLVPKGNFDVMAGFRFYDIAQQWASTHFAGNHEIVSRGRMIEELERKANLLEFAERAANSNERAK